LGEPTINHKLISDSLNAIYGGNVDSAFESLNKINGLGISYISKILYFASKAKKLRDYPLIFDIRVARSIVSLSTGRKFDNILDVKPINTLRAYKEYNSLLHGWGKEMKVGADQIELFLFSQDVRITKNFHLKTTKDLRGKKERMFI
jgi:hypothetical protein